MLVSVIVPAYNCSAFLEKTVGDILVSGLEDFEILLVDDGSTDGTAQCCDILAEKYEEVRCIHQKNAGVSAARNSGIESALGEYILFFDADDAVDSGALKHAVQSVQENRPDMLIFGLSFDYYFHNKQYRREELVHPAEGFLNRQQIRDAFDSLFQYNALSPVWNKIIRKQILLDSGVRFLGSLIEMEDFVFSVHCLTHCATVYMLPEAIYRYRLAEEERKTYNRLCRIPSLTQYMRPFESCIAQLMGKAGDSVLHQIYVSFFHERIRFASPAEIRKASQDMLRGKYAAVIMKADPTLYKNLQSERYLLVWTKNAVRRLRHWSAVRVKYLLRFRG